MKVCALLCLSSFILLRTGQAEERPMVDTKYGKLRGVIEPLKETPRTADAFYGIPFAKPPVGPLRFANPELPKPWESIRDASQYPPMCLQHVEIMEGIASYYKSPFKMPPLSEDCLYLNIFTPSDRDKKSKLPVLSPLTKGLFHKAIAESGTVAMPGMAVSKPEELTFYRDVVSEVSGCDVSSVVECLKRKSEKEILSATEKLGFLPLPICVDGVFLPKPVEEILANKESNRVPLLLGVCNHEFGWMLPQIFNLTEITEGMNRELVRRALHKLPILGLSSAVLPSALDEYLSDVSDPFSFRDRFLDICGDVLFIVPTRRVANYHRDSGLPVYFYEYQHRPSLFDGVRPDFVKADHVDEIVYVFGGPFLRDGVLFAGHATDEEKALSRTIMRYWANFARNGNPNGPGQVEWPLYDKKEQYLEINLKQKASARLKEDKFNFWSKILSRRVEEGGEHIEL
ncbi:fatty acyl-CoA hydrolase precursor, medium chain-like isoform X3 [Aquarana catesbeiana]|uniref:fatty acyl-CoA hydrolase precursor, medium chain-like isoform X3 n=1 Tax=Aquarana catesbeiana TaxID=8400 RepID=UPI003CC9A820